MLVLELFAGTRSIGKAFEKRGHKVCSVDWDAKFQSTLWDWANGVNPMLRADISKLTKQDVIKFCGGVPNIVWASPDCSTYSVAAISYHRNCENDGNLSPKTDYARFCDATNSHVIDLIREINPLFWFIENPVGGLRKMRFMQGLPRYTVTYCQYGDSRQKPTDIWTNHPEPNFKPPCKSGAPCHISAPRGSKTGTQGLKGSKERAVIPPELCEHIVDICEKSLLKPAFRINTIYSDIKYDE